MEKISKPTLPNTVEHNTHSGQSLAGPKPQGIGDTPDQLSVSSCLGCLHMIWNAIVECWTIFYESAFATKEEEAKEKQIEETFQMEMGAVCATPSHLRDFRIKWEVLEQRWDPTKDGKAYIADFHELSPETQAKVRKYLIDNQKADLEKVIKEASSWTQKFTNLIGTDKSAGSDEKMNIACDAYLIKYGPSKGVIALIKEEHEAAEKLADAVKKLLN